MNILFHHFQKCGGSGISRWILDGLGDRAKEFGPTNRSGNLPCDVVARRIGPAIPDGLNGLDPRWRAVVGHYVHPRVARLLGWEDYRQVTVIRHPAERMFSQFRHLERQGGEQASSRAFGDWVAQRGGTPWRLCWCLDCHCFGGSHAFDPMVKFYASRVDGRDPEAAREFLKRCDIYTMGGIPEFIPGLARALDLDQGKYEPLGVTGEGAKVSDAQRALVAARHGGDMELYDWALQRVVA
jgi:hypothetical protein